MLGKDSPKWAGGCATCNNGIHQCMCSGHRRRPKANPLERAAWDQQPPAKVPPQHPIEDTFALAAAEQAAIENVLAAEALLGSAAVSPDAVNLPKHYARFKIEPIRFICENGLNFFQGNIIKYVLRHDAKNGLEDLRKAERYLRMFVKFTEGDPDWWKAELGERKAT